MLRHVKGVLFADYVRMIRSHHEVDWSRHLSRNELAYLEPHVERDAWYPMDVFERLGNAILHEIAQDELPIVQMWGRFSVDALQTLNPLLVAPGDPVDTLMRFRVLRSTYFDFEALTVATLTDDQAQIGVRYYMGATAEEAASFQTLGFFERLLEVGGASDVQAGFSQRWWEGDERTMIDLTWQTDPR